MVAQSEIKSDINLSNVAVATGGGMLGALIGAAVDSARAKKAEALITPVRTGMAGVDADAMAIDAAKAAFANAQWNTVAEPNFSKDSSPVGKSAYLDSNANAETAFVEYTYDLSPTFDALRVVESIQVAAKTVPAANKPAHRQLKAAAKRLVVSYVKDHAEDLHRVWETERPFELHLDGLTISGRADVILDMEGGVPASLAIVAGSYPSCGRSLFPRPRRSGTSTSRSSDSCSARWRMPSPLWSTPWNKITGGCWACDGPVQ